jgi:hypothetical protein
MLQKPNLGIKSEIKIKITIIAELATIRTSVRTSVVNIIFLKVVSKASIEDKLNSISRFSVSMASFSTFF